MMIGGSKHLHARVHTRLTYALKLNAHDAPQEVDKSEKEPA
jgi:hypothetical protein